MKKLLFVAVLGVIVLSSCSKAKDCTCVLSYTGTGATGMTPVTTAVHIEDGECADMNTTTTVSGLTQTMVCTEK